VVLAAGDGETWAVVRARSWRQVDGCGNTARMQVHECPGAGCAAARGRAPAGEGEAKALWIAGSRARVRGAGRSGRRSAWHLDVCVAAGERAAGRCAQQ